MRHRPARRRRGHHPAGSDLIVAAAPQHVADVRSAFIDQLTPAQLQVLGDIGDVGARAPQHARRQLHLNLLGHEPCPSPSAVPWLRCDLLHPTTLTVNGRPSTSTGKTTGVISCACHPGGRRWRSRNRLSCVGHGSRCRRSAPCRCSGRSGARRRCQW